MIEVGVTAGSGRTTIIRALIASRARFYDSSPTRRYTMTLSRCPDRDGPARSPRGQRRPDLLGEGLGRMDVVVGMPRAKPEPQAVFEVPGDDVQVQVGDRLADDVVDEDHRAVRAQAVFDRALEALSRAGELRYPVRGQVAEQADVQLGHEQRVASEERPVIEESDQPFGLKYGHRGRLTAEEGAEGAGGWYHCASLSPRAPRPLSCSCWPTASARMLTASARMLPHANRVSSNHTQVPAGSRRNPQRCAISLTRWNPRPSSSCPSASRQCGSPVCPSSMTSTCTTGPRWVTATVTLEASVACWTAFVMSSQASSSASSEAG